MGIGNFYKQPKPSKFRYIYRFYDPKKEADEKRRRRVRRQYGLDDNISPEDIKEEIKGSFRKQSDHLAKYDKEMVADKSFAERNRTSIIILILGVVLLGWLFKNLGTGMGRYIAQGFSNIFSLFG
ncbi:MAG: hypothetical protein PUK66_04795 [Bacteroidales bacterium]|uniref:hypothetical protein n=1 Tax=Porphyromonas sp. TaxID=1924944 RepID=UPI002978405D|nr:hypothetical protein [Porphyromonas sp.]MDD7438143.1 hypothetical protein [Bacteroidales bacterium]MDY3066790.1 hypothetical protein [Porphyromonas sp.]